MKYNKRRRQHVREMAYRTVWQAEKAAQHPQDYSRARRITIMEGLDAQEHEKANCVSGAP